MSKQVVLLTGASRGLGLGIAALLLKGSSSSLLPPSRVVTLSRSHPKELQDLEKQFPEDLLCVQGDVTKVEDNTKAVKAAADKWGRLDSVVLNSGIIVFKRIADMTAEEFLSVTNVNLLSLHLTLQASLPLLQKSPTGVGKVVLVSSGAAVGNSSAWGAYNASKAAANALIRTLANEERGDASSGRAPIAAFAVRPGVIDTDMQADLRANAAPHADPEAHDRFVKMHEAGELLRPEQPGHVLAALAVSGTRSEPKGKDGKGLGEAGAFFNWNGEEVSDAKWQLPK